MKFIDSAYDPNTGMSIVIIQHLGIKFEGTAKVHPEDKGSNYFGCQLAEIRAKIKALKYERKLAKQKADDALDFIKSCEGYKKFNKEDDTAKVMYRQINRRIQKVNDLADKINELIKEEDKCRNQRQIILRAIERHKEMTKKDK